MADGYLIIDRRVLESAMKNPVAGAMAQILASAVELPLPGTPMPRSDHQSSSPAEGEASEAGKYRIGVGANEVTYSDLIDSKLDKAEFNQADAMRIVSAYATGLSERFKDSMRRSLDKDERFVRLRDRKGIWWQRVGGQPQAPSDPSTT
jgi:hypothetical protein